MQKATRQQTKDHNRSLVLKTIFEHASISRAEIARLTSLTRTTVSEIVADLMAEGLVDEIGLGTSLGGKSPILLSLVENSRYLIGLDLAQNQFSGAIINLRGQIQETVNLPVNNRNGDEALGLVYQIIDSLVRDEFQPIVGIGVGTPGLVDTRAGVVVNAVNLDWRELPLAHLLQTRYGLPVFVLNDSQAAAMGEFTYGEANPKHNNLVVINVGHGIGAGIVIDGQLFQGDGGGAGEIGHVVVVHEGGLLCRCGNYGCLETLASAQAVLKRVKENTHLSNSSVAGGDPGSLTIPLLAQAFTDGDPMVCQAVLEAGRYLGLAISSLVGTLNIHQIMLSGEMTRFGPLWLAAVRETLDRNAFSLQAEETRVDIGQLDRNRIVLGASALLLKGGLLLMNR
jgi:glucokinase-like ROK family protein